MRLGRAFDVLRVPVGLGIHGDRFNPELVEGSDDPDGDLTTVGDQDPCKHQGAPCYPPDSSSFATASPPTTRRSACRARPTHHFPRRAAKKRSPSPRPCRALRRSSPPTWCGPARPPRCSATRTPAAI